MISRQAHFKALHTLNVIHEWPNAAAMTSGTTAMARACSSPSPRQTNKITENIIIAQKLCPEGGFWWPTSHNNKCEKCVGAKAPLFFIHFDCAIWAVRPLPDTILAQF